MDGLDQDEPEDKGDDRRVIPSGLFATHGKPLESFRLADQDLDPCPQSIKRLREKPRLIPDVRTIGNDRQATVISCGRAIGLGIVALVGDHGARRDLGFLAEQDFELLAIRGLGAGQMEVERQPIEVALDVDLRAEAAAGAAKCLIWLPPFAPAAETWARAVVLSNIWINPAVSLQAASA